MKVQRKIDTKRERFENHSIMLDYIFLFHYKRFSKMALPREPRMEILYGNRTDYLK